MREVQLVHADPYMIQAADKDFVISRLHGGALPFAEVRLEKYTLSVGVGAIHRESWFDDNSHSLGHQHEEQMQTAHGLHDFEGLLTKISRLMVTDCVPPDPLDDIGVDCNGHLIYNPLQIAVRAEARKLREHLLPQWQRLLDEADPQVREIQGLVFRATEHSTPREQWSPARFMPECWPEFYRQDCLLGDIQKYRAARIAVADWMGFDTISQEVRTCDLGSSEGRMAVLEALNGWRAMYSPSGRTYASLDETLDHLPDDIPARLVPMLSTVRLERPIFERLHLELVLARQARLVDRGAKYDPDRLGRNLKVLLSASKSEIEEAVRRLDTYRQASTGSERVPLLHPLHPLHPLLPRCSVGELAKLLAAYPNEHQGSIVDLTDEAWDWRRAQARAEYEALVSQYAHNPRTAPTPIDLSCCPEITFLGDAQAVIEECYRMHQGIYDSVARAIDGECFFFHVEWDGSQALAMVERGGYFVHAYASGSHYGHNPAADYGEHMLGLLWSQQVGDLVWPIDAEEYVTEDDGGEDTE